MFGVAGACAAGTKRGEISVQLQLNHRHQLVRYTEMSLSPAKVARLTVSSADSIISEELLKVTEITLHEVFRIFRHVNENITKPSCTHFQPSNSKVSNHL